MQFLQHCHTPDQSGTEHTPSSSLHRYSSTLGGRGSSSSRRRTTLRLTLSSRLIGIAGSRRSREGNGDKVGVVAASRGLLVSDIGGELDIGALYRNELVSTGVVKQEKRTYSIKTTRRITTTLNLKGSIHAIGKIAANELLSDSNVRQTELAQSGDLESRREDNVVVVTGVAAERQEDLDGSLSVVHLQRNGE
jgi:hypothetical protein